MKTWMKSLLYALFALAAAGTAAWVWAGSAVGADCSCKGKNLFGKVQVVQAFPDLTVQIVTAFPDLKVQVVSAFPDKCGKWQMVDSFPDLTVQFVDAFPDVKIQYVEAFPGLP